MKERPILFSAPMVRAILAGSKTQTRRVMRKQFCHDAEVEEMCATNERGHQIAGHSGMWWDAARCPYGQPGDLLWVREAHWWFKDEHNPATGYFPPKLTAEDVEYRADGDDGRKVWRPSIHMPRWASRITLEITDVRVERLQDISEADAIAEGIEACDGLLDEVALCARAKAIGIPASEPRVWFAALWESVNGPGSWDANPWVWCVSFRRIEQ